MDLLEFFKPVTETQKETQKETQRAITSGLRPIRKGLKPIKGLKGIKTAIEQLPQRLPQQLPQQIGYPLSTAPPSYRTTSPLPSTLGEEEEEEKKDTTFGFFKKDDHIFIGNKKVVTDKDKKTIIIGEKEFKLTPGLWTLITHKSPKKELITEKDKENYASILSYSNTMHLGNNPHDPRPKASRSPKWKNFVKPVWDKRKEETDSGLKKVVIPADPNALLEKLDLLRASKAAGNTGMRNELVSVCDELKRQGIFDSEIYKKIMSVV